VAEEIAFFVHAGNIAHGAGAEAHGN
jgi:hypothetical protein